MDQTTIIIWLLAIVIILIAVLYVVIKRKREAARNAAKGRRGEAAVASKLRSICRSKGFALLNNVYLPLYDTTTQLDHIVVATLRHPGGGNQSGSGGNLRQPQR